MTLKDMPPEDLRNMASFTEAALNTDLKPGESCTFTCPICGATAIAKSSPINGRIHAYCEGCRNSIIQ